MTYADGLAIYDADSHLMELPGWLEEHAEPAERELLRPLHLGAAGALADREVARAEGRRDDPDAARRLEDRLMTAKGWSALGAFEPAERSRALDLLGFDRQLVFSTFAATQFTGSNLERAYAGARAHNRAMGAWCGEDPRLIGVGFVPLDDPERATAAVGDVIAFGCGAVHLPSAPPRDKAPTHPDFAPMWARIADAGLPVVLHLGGQGAMIKPTFHNNGRPVTDLYGGGENLRAKDGMAMHMAPEVFVSTLIFDGLFDTHPDLMVGVIEQGAEWVVPWLPRLDRMQHAFNKTEPDLAALELKASEYVHRNVRATPFVGERVGWMIEQAGEDLFLFSSDYPHPEGHRDPIAKFEATMDGVGEQARRRFYRDNLADLLGRAG
jgi:predicted TIM-barrel fold metal-dependent hydrolase